MNKLILTILILFFCIQLNSETIHILDDTYSIQLGISNSVNGDTILVHPGEYFENIYISSDKNIVIGSLFLTTQDSSYISQTIINGNDDGTVVRFSGTSSDAALIGLTITGGYAENGGGIKCSFSNPYLSNLIIKENFAGLMFVTGGAGIYLVDSNPIIENVIIKDNLSQRKGGAVFCIQNSNPILMNVTMQDNVAYNEGGGLYSKQSNPLLINCTIQGNWGNDGGGISCYDENEITVLNCQINGNSAGQGGAVYLRNHCDFNLINCTVVNNSALDNGSAFHCRIASNPVIVNSILWNESPEEIFLGNYDETSSVTISYSDIQNGEEAITINNGTVNWLEGNIDLDPLFEDSLSVNFQLTDNSPCINSGTPDTTGLNLPEYDLNGNSRIFNEIIDMGAFENQTIITNIDENNLPMLELNQNYPNPFNPTTTIKFSIQQNSIVELSVFNIKGQKVKQLVKKNMTAGDHSVIWNGKNESNDLVTSGVYCYKLNINGKSKAIKKCLLLK